MKKQSVLAIAKYKMEELGDYPDYMNHLFYCQDTKKFSILTTEEDIKKSNQWFRTLPVKVYLAEIVYFVEEGREYLLRMGDGFYTTNIAKSSVADRFLHRLEIIRNADQDELKWIVNNQNNSAYQSINNGFPYSNIYDYEKYIQEQDN